MTLLLALLLSTPTYAHPPKEVLKLLTKEELIAQILYADEALRSYEQAHVDHQLKSRNLPGCAYTIDVERAWAYKNARDALWELTEAMILKVGDGR